MKIRLKTCGVTLLLLLTLGLSAQTNSGTNTERIESYQYELALQVFYTYLQPVNVPYTFIGDIGNYGTDTIKTLNIKYTVNGGPTLTSYQRLTIPPGVYVNYTDSIPWTPPALGIYTIKIWLDGLNGSNANQNPSWDTVLATFMVVDSVMPKKVLVESFTQASCSSCYFSAPFDDQSMATAAQLNICNAVRYHVNWPGTDYMNNETQIPFVANRGWYYGVGYLPDFKIDGSLDMGGVDVQTLQNEASVGSPFRIKITSFSFDSNTNTYNAGVTVKSFGSFPANLSLRSVLTVDTIKYSFDQSTEDPPSSFAPPIGTGSNPDSTYTYVMNFPWVAEDMMPSYNGIAMGTFTPGSTQTYSLSWTKNHPWGANPSVNAYDSLFRGVHLTVFIQTDNPLSPLPATYVFQSATFDIPNTTTGIKNISGPGNDLLNVFPNPSPGYTNLSFNLSKPESVRVVIYNMLGEIMYQMNSTMSAGKHQEHIDCRNCKTGIYTLAFSAGSVYTVRKLVIEQ